MSCPSKTMRPSSQREEADEGATEGRLAAAGFPDQAKCLALLNLEGDVVDSMHRATSRWNGSPLDREVFDHVLRLQQGRTVGGAHGDARPDNTGIRRPHGQSPHGLPRRRVGALPF